MGEDPARREILRIVEQLGAATLAQIAKATGKSWGAVQWHVYVLEREGRLKSVKIGPMTYYFTNPQKGGGGDNRLGGPRRPLTRGIGKS